MAAGNNVVVKTVNRVIFESDKNSYSRTIKQIRSIKKEWERAGKAMRKATNGINPKGGERFKPNEYSRRTKAARAEAAAAKQAAREKVQAERRIQTIRAKSIRFNTAASSYNLTGKQRIESLKQFGDLTRQFHQGKIAVGEYNAAVAKLQANMRKQGRVGMKGQTLPVTAKVTKLDTSLIDSAKGAIVIGATVALGKSIMTAGQDLQSMESGLTAVTGSADKAAKEMQYLRDQSNRLGLDLIGTGKDYTKFLAAVGDKATQKQTRTLFEGVSEYGTVLGASAEDQSRALKALNQMYSKGTVMSEELKGQLGDALPGTVSIFVKALQKVQNNANLTEKDLFKMMEQGQLLAKDILPAVGDEFKALARNGGALDKAVLSNRASFQRLKTAMQASMGAFFEGGFGTALTNAFDTISAALNNNSDAFKFWGDLAGNVIEGAVDSFSTLYNTIVLVARVGAHYLEEMGFSFEAMKGWGEMAAYALGVTAFAGAMWKLGGAIKWIVGFLNPLTKLLGVMKGIAALGGVGAAAGAGGRGRGRRGPRGGGPAGGQSGGFGSGALVAGGSMLGAAATNPYAWPVALGAYAAVSTDNATRETDGLGLLDSIAARWKAGGWANHEANKAAEDALKPTVNLDSVTSGSALMNNYRYPVALPSQTHKLEVTSKVEVVDGAVKGLVRSEIDDRETKQLNMLLQGGQ
ncbi:tape measure protein [Serratia fonticola]|uniref:tape measure protein n=1 Tax=Serratia fonticola TaxID=47917 RepID=UPI00211C84FE|nr:tape measure protein [Serratia fonticola]